MLESSFVGFSVGAGHAPLDLFVNLVTRLFVASADLPADGAEHGSTNVVLAKLTPNPDRKIIIHVP